MLNALGRIAQRLHQYFLPEAIDNSSIPRQCQLILANQYEEMFKNTSVSFDLQRFGFNVYSATYEDGILLFLLSLVGMASRKCVDLGSGGVRGSNTANLIVNHGFSGLLVDGNERGLKKLNAFYSANPETSLFPPKTVLAFITKENVNEILSANGFRGEIDVLSIDLDGMDYWIWDAITTINPRIVLVEYQDIIGPDRSWTVPYKADFQAAKYPVNKSNFNYCGASLRAFTKLARSKNYRLVGCNRGGWNAFFVRNDLALDKIPEIKVESCFSSDWNHFGMQFRFPLIEKLEWVEV